MKAEFTSFSKDSNWVDGVVGEYKFQAKLFDEGSEYGINGGRVSKLSIRKKRTMQEKSDFLSDCIVNYDRGWDIEPKEEYTECYNAVMELLENSPKRF